ncbi:MAG TPA: flagellar export protein FliJ [Candidatus Macondimonas sp.]|nr:flagellar export protein FliJ [Candidatus Macondimonas sp.]
MTDIERLKPLHQLARNDTDRAARELGQSLLRQETLNQQMVELVRYRDSYRQELHRAMADSLRVDQVRTYRNMLERLDQAIERQRGILSDQAGVCESARYRYLDRQSRLQALGQLIVARQEAQQVRRIRLEQHSLDDLMQSRWRPVEQLP